MFQFGALRVSTGNLRSEGWAGPLVGLCALSIAALQARADSGSLLIFPDVEIAWDAAGQVTQDTIINLNNGYPDDVSVQLYFVNGDPPLAPVFDFSGALIERGHLGWVHAGCTIRLSRYQPIYWSALTGRPDGCSFAILDYGPPPGRPDPEHPGGRILRGFIYAWAVDNQGREINWNYLSGDATIYNFVDGAAWGYEAEGFRALQGNRGDLLPPSGVLQLDGVEYEMPYSTLRLNFSAVGDVPLFGDDRTVHVDTDLTLMPVSQDFRQDNDGPVVTKAKFDIVNRDEVQFSGTTRCITCWDQTLLSHYGTPNHFLYEHIHTEVGTARIDGIASAPVCGPFSEPAALLGVAVRIVSLPTTAGAADWTGDGYVTAADFPPFANCLEGSGPRSPSSSADCRTAFDRDEDGDVDLDDFQAMPFGMGIDRSYAAVPLIGEGAQPAVIRYDVP